MRYFTNAETKENLAIATQNAEKIFSLLGERVYMTRLDAEAIDARIKSLIHENEELRAEIARLRAVT